MGFKLLTSRFFAVVMFVVVGLFSNALLMAQGAGGDTPVQKNVLGWLIESLGWGYIFIFLALSFIFFAFLIMNILAARRDFVCPQILIDGFEAHLDQKQYQEAYELSKADESFLGNVLSSGLAKLSSSYKLLPTRCRKSVKKKV